MPKVSFLFFDFMQVWPSCHYQGLKRQFHLSSVLTHPSSGSVLLFCPFQIGYVWRPVGQLTKGLLFFPEGMSVGTNLCCYGEENSSQHASLLYANCSYPIGPSPFALSLSPQLIRLLLYPTLCLPYINPVPSALL